MSDRARRGIRKRVDDYYSAGDADALFSAEADRDAGRLLSASSDLPLVAELMWCRYEASGDIDALATAIELADRVAQTDPEQRQEALGFALDALDDPGLLPDLPDGEREGWAGLFFHMTLALSQGLSPEEGEDGEDLPRLDRIINGLGLVMELTPPEHPGRLRAMALDARYRSVRATFTGRLDEAEAAVAAMREALAATAVDDPDLPMLRGLYGGTLQTVYAMTGTMEARVALAEALLESVDDEASAAYGAVIADLHAEDGPVTTEQALTLGRLGAAVHPVGDPDRPRALFALAAALSQRAGDRQNVADNGAAVAALREMLDLLDASDDGSVEANVRRAIAQTFLGRFLGQRYELMGDTAGLGEAVDLSRRALARVPAGHAAEGFALVGLGTLLTLLHEIDGNRAILDEAVSVLHRAVELGGPDAPRAMSLLSVDYYTRFRLDGSLEDLDESVALGRRAVAAASDDPSLPDILRNLGNALLMRFNQLGDLADADEAVTIARRALELTPAGHADRAKACQNLGNALLDRYRRTSDATDLDGGVAAMREAAARGAPGTHGAALIRSSLGRALTDRYDRHGVMADLDEAITEIRTALGAVGPKALERPGVLNNLAAALQTRAALTGSSTDLDDAINASREALRLSTAGGRMAATANINLGYLLTGRYRISSRREDIDEAVDTLRAAAAQVGAVERPSVQINLGNALGVRYQSFAEPADLDESIVVIRAAGDDPGVGRLRRLRYRAGLGGALITRFAGAGVREDVDEAVVILREVAVGTAEDEPERAPRLYTLGTALLHRGDPGDRAEAMQTAREAATAAAAPSSLRMDAALRWAGMGVQDGDLDTALAGYEQAIALLPLLAWRALSRADQERQLTDVSGTSCDAAAVAIRRGHPQRAVELLEQGRTVLWSQAVDARDDLAALRDVRPDLADRLKEVRAALGRTTAPPDAPEVDRVPLAREWDRLLAQARALPGFADLLQPRRFAALSAAASQGPVVIVNLSELGCDALIVRPGTVEVVPLPELSGRDVVDRLNEVYVAFGRPPSGLGEIIRHHQLVARLLEWLWTTVVGPVLERLGDVDGQRVWWCPTGYTALLPLHAATDPRTGRSAVDLVVSSYTPTLRALQNARAADPTGEPSTLVVAVPHTSGAPDLNVQPEVDAIDRHSAGRPTVLIGPDATAERVRAALPRHRRIHFACHGVQNLADPSRSALLLHDRDRLTVLDIAELGLANAELAFLSACQTAGGGAVLADEAIHLAAALHMNGFRHIVATLWPMYDATAPEVTERVYAGLAASGTADTARHLHEAVRDLRAGRATGLPAFWAPYIHIGP